MRPFGHDEVRLDASQGAEVLQGGDAVDGARGAGQGDDEAVVSEAGGGGCVDMVMWCMLLCMLSGMAMKIGLGGRPQRGSEMRRSACLRQHLLPLLSTTTTTMTVSTR